MPRDVKEYDVPMTEHFKCPLCQREEYRATRFVLTGGQYVRCSCCDLLSLFPMPSAAELEALYREGYYHTDGRVGYQDYERLRESRSGSFRRFAKRIARQRPRGRVLDIGCAFGFFVEACLEEGLDAEGIDIAPDALTGAAEAVRGKLHHASVMEFAGSRPAEFDAIFVAETLEHVSDPRGFINAGATLLKSGGLLYCLTPNEHSLLARLSGCRWVSLKPPEHVVLYNPSTLRVLLERCFRVISIGPAFQHYPMELIAARLHALSRPLGFGAQALVALGLRRPVMIPDGQMLCVAERLDP